MLRFSLSLLLVASLVSNANAATLRLNWADSPEDPTLVVTPGQSTTVEVWVDLLGFTPGAFGGRIDVVNTVFFSFTTSVTDQLTMNAADIVARPGWQAGGESGTLGGQAQFAVAAPAGDPGLDSELPGRYLVGTFVITNNRLNPGGGPQYVTAAAFEDMGVLDSGFNPLNWDSRYNLEYAGYVAYGDWGHAGWSRLVMGEEVGQPTPNPLVITIPEPACAGLLLFAGLALLRRH